jgi:hypothetical protein
MHGGSVVVHRGERLETEQGLRLDQVLTVVVPALHGHPEPDQEIAGSKAEQQSPTGWPVRDAIE